MMRRLGLGKNNHLTYASLALNPRYIYIIKQIAGQLIQETNLISILMHHMLLHKAQTQHEVTFITGFLVQRQGDQ